MPSLTSENGHVEQHVNGIAVAMEHDRRVREIDGLRKSLWSELGMLCIMVHDNKEWQLLGHHSYEAWIAAAAPYSRSTVYAAVSILRELSDISFDDLKAMPIGNAKVLGKLPRASRSNPKVLRAAKEAKPQDFLAGAAEAFPDAHLEAEVVRKYKFTLNQAKDIDTALEMGLLLEEATNVEDMIANLCARYIIENEDRWRELTGVKG